MTNTSAKILSKGCDKTGITTELAQQLYAGGRTSILAIVELEVVQDHTNRVSGKNAVDLAITTIEPVVSNSTVIEERAQDDIRRVAKALFVNRKMGDGEQLTFDDNEPVLADVLAATEALVVTDDNGDVTGLYDGEPTYEPAQDSEAPEDQPADKMPAFSDA